MRRVISLVIITVFTLTYVFPLSVFAEPAKKDYAVAEYAGKNIHWTIVFSPEGASLNEAKSFRVKEGGDIQILSGIYDPKESVEAKNVALTLVDPKNKEIGTAEDAAKEAKKIKLAKYPKVEKLDEIDAAIAKHVKKLKKEKKAHSSGLDKIATKEELKAASKELKTKIKSAKNAGQVIFPETRFENTGFSSLHMVNPGMSGIWKMKLKAKDSSPFIASVLIMPVEMTEEHKKELNAAWESISSQIKAAFPEYKGWGWSWWSCDNCCKCKGKIYGACSISALITAYTGGASIGFSLYCIFLVVDQYIPDPFDVFFAVFLAWLDGASWYCVSFPANWVQALCYDGGRGPCKRPC